MGGHDELRTGLSEVADPGEHRQAAVHRQRRLRLVEQVQSTRPEPVGSQVEERFAVGTLVQALLAGPAVPDDPGVMTGQPWQESCSCYEPVAH